MAITPDNNPAGQGSGFDPTAALGSNPTPATPTISNAANAATNAAAQPGMVPTQPTPPPPTEHHSTLVNILRAVGDALSGGPTQKRVNPQTGLIEDVPRSTGSMIGGAITTLARGAAAGAAQHGPGSLGQSAVAGANAQEQFQQQQQQQLQQQSENVRQTQAATQAQQLTQASLAKSNQDLARTALDMKALGMKFDEDQAALVNQMSALRSINGAQVIGHFDDNRQINAYLFGVGSQQSAQHARDFANNLIRVLPSPTGGFDAIQLPKGWQDQAIGPGKMLSVMATGMDKDGKPAPQWKVIPAPENMSWGEYTNWQSTVLTNSTNASLKQLQMEHEQASTEHEKAATQHEQAETNLTNKKIAAAPAAGSLLVGSMPDGSQVAGTMDELTRYGASGITKLDANNASKTVIARQLVAPGGLFALVNNDLRNLDAKGKLGVAASRWNEFMGGKVGDDPDFAPLRTDMGLLSTALMQAHVGARGSAEMLEHFKNLADYSISNGATLRQALAAEYNYVHEKAMLPRQPIPQPQGGQQ